MTARKFTGLSVSFVSGTPSILTVFFAVAKLAGWSDWSWWWVASPLLVALTVIWGLYGVSAASGAILKRRGMDVAEIEAMLAKIKARKGEQQ